MAIGSAALVAALSSHAQTTGLFDQVNTHEVKNAPGNGVYVEIWVSSISPLLSSGLASTSLRIEFNVRIRINMVQEPQDDIDTNLMNATDVLMDAYSGDFDLGVSNVRCVDLLGQSGSPLQAASAYLEHDKKIYRVMDITLPILLNDVWTQVT